MIAAGFIFLTGCSRQRDPNENVQAGGDIDNEFDNDIATGEADADIALDQDADISADGDLDFYGDLDRVDADLDEGVDADADEARPETPFAPGTSKFSEAPCAFPASLSYDANSDRLFTTCGGQPNAIFRSTPMSDEGDLAWEEAGYANGFPSNQIKISDDLNLITHSSPDGFTIVDSSIGATVDGVDFSALSLSDDLGFVPNYPGGAAFAGGWIYVATSNIDVADYTDPTKTTYHVGTVIACPYDFVDGLNDEACVAHQTSVKNPTGMMLLNDGEDLAVLSSNIYDLSEGNNAALTIYDLETMDGTVYSLGNVTAQISPKLAMTSGGLMVIGVQKPINGIVTIDPTNGDMDSVMELANIANFISAVETFGDTAIVSDFGIFGEGGRVIFTDTRENGWTGMPETPLLGSAGPSVMIGNKLYQVVTANDGMSASIWQINVEGM